MTADRKHSSFETMRGSDLLSMRLDFLLVATVAWMAVAVQAWTPSFRVERPTINIPTPAKTNKDAQQMVSSLILATTILMSTPSYADFDPRVFANSYDDPLHPLCGRHITILNTKDGSFRYDGTAVGPKGADSTVLRGCSKEEIKTYGLRTGTFTGRIVGNTISAGDGIHEGVWEPAGSVVGDVNIKYTDVDGIRWNDGNKWTVKKKTAATKVGEFIFLSYIGFSCLAGVKGIYDGIQRRRRRALE